MGVPPVSGAIGRPMSKLTGVQGGINNGTTKNDACY